MAQQIVRGFPITLDGFYYDGTGAAVDPPDPKTSILDPTGTVVVSLADPTRISTGHYQYVYTPASDAQVGAWAARWFGTVSGAPLTDDDGFTVVASGSISSGVSGAQTCTPWATHEDACAPCDAYSVDTDVLDEAMQVASDILFQLTGRKYAGSCTDTIWPQAQWAAYARSQNAPSVPSWAFCSCHAGRDTGCGGISEIKLPGYPVSSDSIVVTIAGEAFEDFTLDDRRYLRRTDGESWPCCNTFDSDGWSITYPFGERPPLGGVKAAALLGCQIALSWQPDLLGGDADRCKLPDRVTQVVRQGITISMIDPETLFKDGIIGLPMVDMWVSAERVGNARRRASAIQPGKHRSARRVNQ